MTVIVQPLSYFRGYVRKKWPLEGNKHADNLFRFQVSGVRFQYLTSPFPDTRHLKPETFIFLQHVVRKMPLRA
jgi:hypothetical protein